MFLRDNMNLAFVAPEWTVQSWNGNSVTDSRKCTASVGHQTRMWHSYTSSLSQLLQNTVNRDSCVWTKNLTFIAHQQH